MDPASLLNLPMHSRNTLVVHMEAVNADVTFAVDWVVRDYLSVRDKTPAVFRPADLNRQPVEVGRYPDLL